MRFLKMVALGPALAAFLGACGNAEVTTCAPGHVCERQSSFYQAPAPKWGTTDSKNYPRPSWASNGSSGTNLSMGYQQYNPYPQVGVNPSPVVQSRAVGDEASSAVTSQELAATPEKPKQLLSKEKPKTAEWYPWWTKRVNLTREEFAKAVAKNDPKILRVSRARLIPEIGNLVPSPQDPELFAGWLEKDSRVTEISCTDEILKQYYMMRTNKDGTVIDRTWSRKSCYKGEKLLVYMHDDGTKQVFLSLGCGNGMARKDEAPAKVSSVKVCPQKERESKQCPR